MNKETQIIITTRIVKDLKLHKVNTNDAIGLLEVLKLAIYTESIKGV